jgi:hypothetical protein
MNALQHFRPSRSLILLAAVLLFCIGCGPNNRGPFVGVWRLDADYFKEQLDKQELKSEEAKAALDESIPLWTSFKVEYTFSANGRYQVASQMGGGSVSVEKGTFEVVEDAGQILRFTANNQKDIKSVTYRFINDDTLELDVETELVGFPKTARFLRAKADEATAVDEKKAAP